MLLLHPLDGDGTQVQRYALKDLTLPEAWSSNHRQPRMIVDLNDGGNLEILDPAQWQRALDQSGYRPGLAQRMQTRWPLLLGVATVALVGLVAFYKYGTPWAATQLTRFIPLQWELSISDTALSQMDGGMLKPSKVSQARQEQLRAEFQSLLDKTPDALKRYKGYAPNYSLSFRRGMGANAFALPGGAIVVTDGLVETAARKKLPDEAIIGVLAHEIGHVVHRHTTRMVVEQGVLNTGLGLALGDVSSIVATGSTLLTGLAYRRSHEREADCFAMALLGHSRLSSAPMADLLLAMAADRDQRTTEDSDDPTPASAPAPAAEGASKPASASASNAPSGQQENDEDSKGESAWTSLLSTHPDTVARAQELRSGKAEHCQRLP